MIEIADATIHDCHAIQQIAENTWWPTFSGMVPDEQIRYMLGTMYDAESIKRGMADGSQQFILLKDTTGYQAFASYGPRKEKPDVFKLHKLFVLPENQGKGYGFALIEEIKHRLSQINIRILDLNVNRFNNARSFYEKMGFKVISEEDLPIGPYWMNDFVMRLTF